MTLGYRADCIKTNKLVIFIGFAKLLLEEDDIKQSSLKISIMSCLKETKYTTLNGLAYCVLTTSPLMIQRGVVY
jgi:hypothetical protein